MNIRLSIYQILLGFIAVVFLANGAVKFFKNEKGQTFFKLLLTLFIWGSVFSFAIFPRLAHIASERLGLGENFNTLIFIGFVTVFIIIFKLLSIIERLEQNISEIVRKEALSRLDSNKE